MQDSDVSAIQYDATGREPLSISPMAMLLDSLLGHAATVSSACCALRRPGPAAANVFPYKHTSDTYKITRTGTGLIMIDVRRIRNMADDHEGPWFARGYKDLRQTECEIGEDVFFSLIIDSLAGTMVCNGMVQTFHNGLHYRPPFGGDALEIPAIVEEEVVIRADYDRDIEAEDEE